MKKLSTNFTFLWRLLSIVWILYFSIVGIYGIYKYATSSDTDFNGGNLILFILFGLVSSLFVHLIAGTLKNVFLEGNTLVISNFLKQIRVPFSEISHIDNPDLSSLCRIKIIFIKPSEFGKDIVFAPRLFEAKETAKLLKDKIETDYLSL